MGSKHELNNDAHDQPDVGIPKEDIDASSTYIKPYISVDKHGEKGKLFEELFYDDRYKKNKGRNYH